MGGYGTTFPPPPQASQAKPDTSVPAVPTTPDVVQNPTTGMDRFKAFISALSGGGSPALARSVEEHHQRQLAEIQLHQQNMQTLAGILAKARITGKDPRTGQPVTPEQMAQWNQQYDAAQAAWQKLVGKSKGAKGIAQRMSGVLDHLTGRAPQGQGAAGGPPKAQTAPAAAPPAPPPPTFAQEYAGIPEQAAMAQGQAELEGKQGEQKAIEQRELAVEAEKAKGREAVAQTRATQAEVKAAARGDKKIDAYNAANGKRILEYQRPDGSRYYEESVDDTLSSQPTVRSSSSTYDPATGTTSTTSTSGKSTGKTAAGAGKRGTAPPPPRAGKSGAAPAGGRIESMAKAWAESGVEPGAKDKAAVEQYMQEHGLEPGQKPTTKDKDLARQLKQVEPMVDKLESFLKDNDLTKAGEGGMFSPGAWYERSKVEKAWKEYTSGLPPKDKKLGQLIKYAAAIKIMGAGPWMQIGRGRYLYSEIVQHLPEPTDTPAQLYEKIQFYRNILEDAKASLPSSLQGKPAGPPPKVGPKTVDDEIMEAIHGQSR